MWGCVLSLHRRCGCAELADEAALPTKPCAAKVSASRWNGVSLLRYGTRARLVLLALLRRGSSVSQHVFFQALAALRPYGGCCWAVLRPIRARPHASTDPAARASGAAAPWTSAGSSAATPRTGAGGCTAAADSAGVRRADDVSRHGAVSRQ